MIAQMMSTIAYVGLGSNLQQPQAQVRSGLAALDQIADCRLVASSSLYHGPPLGPQDQPDYVNAVAALECRLAPHALLDQLQEIERTHGRERDQQRWGPRTLDLDLLLYGTLKLFTQRLSLPHPEMGKRAFVLRPLAEIAPELVIPDLGRAADCAARLDQAPLTRIN